MPQSSQKAATTTTAQPYVVNVQDVPRTAEEVQAIRIRLRDLRSALQDAAERRSSVASRLRSSDDRAARGLEDRLQVLDARIVQIEKDISANTALLRSAPAAALVAGTSQEPDPAAIANRVMDEIVPIVAIVSVFVLAPFAIAVSRFIWKRAVAPGRTAAAAVDKGVQRQLESLQQSVDTIAIEVERISEGQRFVTRILSETDRALGAGAAEPLRASKKEAIPSER